VFPRALRLRKNTQILSVFRRGERIRRGFLTVYFLPGTQPAATVIVDTKLSKKAVVRNKLKRQLRSILQKGELPTGSLVARAYPGLEKESFASLQQLVGQCLNHPTVRSRK
jgi:ribonuclease P protein component